MKKAKIKDLIRIISKTGLPFEIEVGLRIEKTKDWAIEYGESYSTFEKIKQSYGEIDIQASKLYMKNDQIKGRFECKSKLICECKSKGISAEGYWMFFDNYRSGGTIPNVQVMNSADTGKTINGFMKNNEFLHHYSLSKVHRSFMAIEFQIRKQKKWDHVKRINKKTGYWAKSNGDDNKCPIYKAIEQATLPLESKLYEKRSVIHNQPIFFYPAVITKYKLYSVNHLDISQMEEKKHLVVEWKGYMIDVVNEAGLEDYLKVVEKDMESYLDMRIKTSEMF